MAEEYLTFKTGRSAGKSIEQVAAENYMTLRWFYGQVIKKNNLHGPFYDRVEEVLKRLNSFVPVVDCTAKRPGCEGKARNISIAPGSVGTSFVYCPNQGCLNTMGYEKAHIYPIQFRILSQLPQFPKYIVRDVQSVLLQCAGAPERKTKQACKEWIDNLVIETAPRVAEPTIVYD